MCYRLFCLLVLVFTAFLAQVSHIPITISIDSVSLAPFFSENLKNSNFAYSTAFGPNYFTSCIKYNDIINIQTSSVVFLCFGCEDMRKIGTPNFG